MQISIVVPTYNQGQYIRDCLASIKSQTYTNFEVIIQDSMSSDSTEAICKEFVREDKRFQYYREKDTGQSDAINRGLARSSGELWTWICSDDYYSNAKAIETPIAAFERKMSEDTSFVGVFGDAEYVSENGESLGPYHQRKAVLTKEDFKLDWPLSQPSSFLVKSKVSKVGGVDPSLHLGMDLDLFLKLLNSGEKLLYVPQLVASVRIQSNSKSIKYRKQTASTALSIIQRHFGDKGNPFESAYAREYSSAQKEEWKEVAYSYAEKVLPGLRDRIRNYKNKHSIVRGENMEVGQPLHYLAVRSTYRSLRTTLRILAWPMRLVIDGCLRLKHASLPSNRKKID